MSIASVSTPGSPISTTDPSYSMTTGETANLDLNTSPLLLEGQSVVSALCVLTDLSVRRGTVIGGLPSASIDTPHVVQQIPGALLTAGHVYRLVWTFSPLSGTVWQQVTTIFVPI